MNLLVHSSTVNFQYPKKFLFENAFHISSSLLKCWNLVELSNLKNTIRSRKIYIANQKRWVSTEWRNIFYIPTLYWCDILSKDSIIASTNQKPNLDVTKCSLWFNRIVSDRRRGCFLQATREEMQHARAQRFLVTCPDNEKRINNINERFTTHQSLWVSKKSSAVTMIYCLQGRASSALTWGLAVPTGLGLPLTN